MMLDFKEDNDFLSKEILPFIIRQELSKGMIDTTVSLNTLFLDQERINGILNIIRGVRVYFKILYQKIILRINLFTECP